eukprot:265451-Chlamydomonas_euryale.AAC.1
MFAAWPAGMRRIDASSVLACTASHRPSLAMTRRAPPGGSATMRICSRKESGGEEGGGNKWRGKAMRGGNGNR